MTLFSPKVYDSVVEVDTTVDMPTVHDRCDRCRQHAFLRAVFPSGSELFFCQHHTRLFVVDLVSKIPEIRVNVRWNDAIAGKK